MPLRCSSRSRLCSRLGRCSLLLAAPFAAFGRPVLAQSHQHPVDPWVQDVSVGVANAFVSGATAGLRAWLGHEDVGRAIVGGAIGGSLVFAGKRIVVEDFGGAGFLGRELAAVGSSVVRNAGRGDPWLNEVWLPLGPLWLQANPGSPNRWRIDGWNVAALVWASTRPELELDWRATTSNGAFIFQSPLHEITSQGDVVDGLAMGGLAVLGPDVSSRVRSVRGHEMVHIVQGDFAHLTWSRPIEGWGWRRAIGREVPIDGALMPLFLLLRPPFVRSLHEAEAGTLEARCGC